MTSIMTRVFIKQLKLAPQFFTDPSFSILGARYYMILRLKGAV